MSNDVSGEIGEMLKAMGTSTADPSEEVNTDGVEEDLNKSKEDENEDSGGDEDLNGDGDGDEDDTPKPDEKDTIINDLKARLEMLEKRGEDTKKEETPSEPEPQDFLGDEDLYELTNDKERFNTLLNQVYSRGIIDAKKSFNEVLPAAVAEKVDLILRVRDARDNFYKENKDLEPFNKVVSAVFEEISTKDPSKSYNDVLKDVADESRKRLNLTKPGTKKDTVDKPPRLPNKKGTSGKLEETQTTNPLQSELDEMNKALGR